jgi:hypothetical protein
MIGLIFFAFWKKMFNAKILWDKSENLIFRVLNFLIFSPESPGI